VSPRAAVVGAGVAGLVAAHDLVKQGWQVDVLERWPGLGGQAATFDVGDGVLLERYYHHWFTSDVHMIELCRELGVEVEWHSSSVSFFAAGGCHPFVSPLDLLRFSPLPLLSRLRMGLAVLDLKLRHKRVEPFEDMTAHEWIVSAMGRPAWERVWGPLMRGKFGSRAEDISMAWLWARLTVRRQIKGSEASGEVLGYPSGSFEKLFVGLRDGIAARGGRVLIDRPAARIEARDGRFAVGAGAPGSFRSGHDPRDFALDGEETYDAVLATVPNRIFECLLGPSLAEELAPGYLDRLRSIEYHSALCLVLELDRRFSDFYWTSICDPELPFIGLIEQTNFIDPGHYGGRRFLYVANYNEDGDPLLELDPDELIAAYEPGLRCVNPDFKRSWIRDRWLYREPDAQPIVTPGYPRKMPPLATGVPGLVLANTTQVYPEDRGTNYAVRLGHQAAELLGSPGLAVDGSASHD
jgi:protoporphyrinogen oxidase